VVAARTAVGDKQQQQKQTLNLTPDKPRRNVRKRPDKTSGRKRPRLQDVDVVAAGDANEATASAVRAAVRPTSPVESTGQESAAATPTSPATQPSSPSSYNNLCCACGMQNPPAAAAGRCKMVIRVQCEKCPRWFHNVCMGLKECKSSQELRLL